MYKISWKALTYSNKEFIMNNSYTLFCKKNNLNISKIL